MFSFSAIPSRYNWSDIRNMEVGGVVSYSFDEDECKARMSRSAAHIIGNKEFRKFKTKTMYKDGVKYMVIGRVE